VLSRRGRMLVATLATVLVALAGCGVPPETGVVRDGPGVLQGALGGGDEPREPPRREVAKDPVQLVHNYLQAAAGDPRKAVDRLRQYLAPGQARTWQPEPQVTVVRMIGHVSKSVPTGTTHDVTAELQPVGILTEQGIVESLPPGQSRVHFKVTVGPDEPAGTRGLFISNAPAEIFLLDTALTDWYKPYSIYFWDTEGRILVPDLRYLPLSLPGQQRPAEVLRWLVGGPSPWLQPAVQPLPPGTTVQGNVVRDGDWLVVNLSAQATAVDTDKLMSQLRWSLWDLDPGPIRLLTEGQPRRDDDTPDRHLDRNAAAVLTDLPDWFCVNNRVVEVRCADEKQTPGPAVVQEGPPVLVNKQNIAVLSAALVRGDDQARTTRLALVRDAGKGWRVLTIGRQAADAKQSLYTDTELRARFMSRPVWLHPNGMPLALGLVAADGQLRQIIAGGGVEVSTVPVRNGAGNGVLGRITAVAVAPDAGRVAMIANGQLYVAAMQSSSTGISIGPARWLFSTLTRLTGVAFTAQDRLAVAGHSGDLGKIAELSIDGATERILPIELSMATVTQLVAYPENPNGRISRAPIMIEVTTAAGSHAHTLYSEQLCELPRESGPAGCEDSATATLPLTAPFYPD
jgi:hypothetical protein